MRTIYGEYSNDQFAGYLKKLHSMVHWLLIYKENGNAILSDYFILLQNRINGLSSLLDNPPEIIELSVLIECAKNENNKGEKCNDQTYRRFILDAHSVIDKIRVKEE